MPKKENFTVRSENLGDLLASAKKMLLKEGIKAQSQRGTTFPYKYAHRGRYFDNGWGYVLAVCESINSVGGNLGTHLKNKKNFIKWLEEIGEFVHIQTVLSVLSWCGERKNLSFWLKNNQLLKSIIISSRIDPLEKIIKEVKNTPETRRAITPSFMYTSDYLLDPMMGVPPYQNFQLLPGKSSDSLSSLHWHRSLDASGGAQLDFNHDFEWLSMACSKTKRKMGSISIITGNLHLYLPEETDNVKDWLVRVTDGYISGSGSTRELLKKEVYVKNVERVFSLLTK
jgi:hypothetical protein